MDMTVVAWVAMVAAAVGSLGCALAGSPRSPGSVVAATAMLVAMVDMGLGHVLLVPMAWAAVLLALGVFIVAPSVAGGCDWRHGLALVAAAVIMVGSPHALPTASAAGHDDHLSHLGAASGPLGVVVVCAYLAAALAGARTRRADLVQALLTAGCLALMAAMSS